MTDYLADEAVRAIAANRNRPFFMYLAFNAPHTPLQALASDYDALPRHREPHRARLRRDDPLHLDRARGTRARRAAGATGSRRTRSCSSRATTAARNYVGLPDLNKPYRGWKMTFFEGGVHEPFFAKWPARLPHGREQRRAGRAHRHLRHAPPRPGRRAAERPRDRRRRPRAATRSGRSAGRPHETRLLALRPLPRVRAGDWKLQLSERPKKAWLFDLSTDPDEHTNLAEAEPGARRGADGAARRARQAAVGAALAVAARRRDPHRPAAERAHQPRRRIRVLGQLACDAR